MMMMIMKIIGILSPDLEREMIKVHGKLCLYLVEPIAVKYYTAYDSIK